MTLSASDDGSYTVRQNVGGLATAIGPYHSAHRDCLWVGWSGIDPGNYTSQQLDGIRQAYMDRRCIPIFLGKDEVRGYYSGFSNGTLWPLLHDFTQEAKFDPNTWRSYQEANRHFADVVAPLVHDDDTIWVQDYHLMLLPRLLRQRFPHASIGWFLHVPFPSPEIFRSIPWSRDILQGVLGSDLLGFHTVDYANSFLASVKLLLTDHRCDDDKGSVTTPDGHKAVVDAFPIGIDYNLYSRTAKSRLARAMRLGIEEASGKRPRRRYMTSLTAEGSAAAEASTRERAWWSHHAHEDLPELTLAQSAALNTANKPNKVIVSVDRLDYTKGIPERLMAFDRMLEKYPAWTGHVTYYLLATPSRENVDTYRRLKGQVDQLVGKINGRYSLLSWTPIHYITRSLSIKPVCGIYSAGDVALITPLRDGMNLVAKEYLACHDDRDGVLVLSEMCGAAKELDQAFIVNPYDTEATCDALHAALETSPEESRRRNLAMQARLRFGTAATWCADFLAALRQVTVPSLADRRLRHGRRSELLSQWGGSSRKLLLCDYDGTLTALVRTPNRARPTHGLTALLRRVATEPGVDLVIVSGRDHQTMEHWFGELPVSLIAEHGAWHKNRATASGKLRPDASWERAEGLPDTKVWKPRIRKIMAGAVADLPRSFIEEKGDALAWHYRLSDVRAARRQRQRLLNSLRSVTSAMGLMVMENSKVVEVCPVIISKGRAVTPWVKSGRYDLIITAGDDTTDETMFAAMPPSAWTIKVGAGPTKAKSRLPNPAAMQRLLGYLAAESDAVAMRRPEDAASGQATS